MYMGRAIILNLSVPMSYRPWSGVSLKPRGIDAPIVTLWGTGKARRELLHVDDLADACLFLLRNYDSPEIINVGSGQDLTIRELAETIAKLVEYHG